MRLNVNADLPHVMDEDDLSDESDEDAVTPTHAVSYFPKTTLWDTLHKITTTFYFIANTLPFPQSLSSPFGALGNGPKVRPFPFSCQSTEAPYMGQNTKAEKSVQEWF